MWFFQPNKSFTEAACVLHVICPTVLHFTLFFNITYTSEGQLASLGLIWNLAPVV